MAVKSRSDAAPRVETLFREFAPYLWRVIRRMGVNESEADDVCQEVFLTAHRQLSSFEGRSTVKTWLYGICLHKISDHRRRAYVRREELMEIPPDPGVAPEQGEAIDQKRARQALDAALATLDHDRRAVFVLYEVEDLSLKEVAKTLNLPLQTVYSRLQTARRQVEAEFRRVHDHAGTRARAVGGNA